MVEESDVIKIKVPKVNKIDTSRLRENPWIMSTFVLILLAIVLLINGTGDITGHVVSENDITEKALALVQLEDPTAEVLNVKKSNGLYEVTVLFNGEETPLYLTLDGENLVSGIIPLDLLLGEPGYVGETPVEGSTFLDSGQDICSDENGKPYVILFSTTWCPHCEWISETFESLQTSYGHLVNVQHWELDLGDDTLTSQVEEEIDPNMRAMFDQFNPEGSIPTYVFGCKYYRIGNGYEREDDLNAELDDFKLIIEKLLA